MVDAAPNVLFNSRSADMKKLIRRYVRLKTALRAGKFATSGE
jgi:hypothetical protein